MPLSRSAGEGLGRGSSSDQGRECLALSRRPLVSPSDVKILFLTPRLPYPLDAGTSLRNFRLIQSAAGEHDVHLLSFVDGSPRPEHLDVLRGVCARVETQAAPPHGKIE